MRRIIKKDITEICNEIDLIIAGKENRNDHRQIYLHLDDALTRKINYSEIELICETIVKIAKTKNRIIRYLERDFWDFVLKIPFHIVLIPEFEIGENEVLISNTEYGNDNKKIMSRILGLAQEIMELKDDNSKGSDIRRSGSLKIFDEMLNYYHIPVAKSVFVSSINSANTAEQLAALEGLENFYNIYKAEIEDDSLVIQNGLLLMTNILPFFL